MKKKIEGNKITILLHFLAWVVIIGIPLYYIRRWPFGKDFIWINYLNTLISGMIFYVNYLILVPGLFFRTKRYRYYLSVLALIVLFYFVSDIANKKAFSFVTEKARSGQVDIKPEERGRMMPPPPGGLRLRFPSRHIYLFNYGFNSVFLIFFSLGLRVFERNSKIEKLQKETEQEKLRSELAFLKSQISPHFFFNTLNNIYSLISINAEDSKKAVLKLSKLMRYLLYESEQGTPRLSTEIDFMQNYIDLMKLRMSDKVDLSVDFPEVFDDVSIPPLLFVPYIENAFKHGISYREKSFIAIRLEQEGQLLKFTCKNSIIAPAAGGGNREGPGIGLENAAKRLNLLFPSRHELKISKTDKVFEVFVQIDIQ
ncbi:MAG TPA: histidine kinase [Bacteroidales bacterium]|nr:histidine kinase [Bacteroidales bacterium]